MISLCFVRENLVKGQNSTKTLFCILLLQKRFICCVLSWGNLCGYPFHSYPTVRMLRWILFVPELSCFLKPDLNRERWFLYKFSVLYAQFLHLYKWTCTFQLFAWVNLSWHFLFLGYYLLLITEKGLSFLSVFNAQDQGIEN